MFEFNEDKHKLGTLCNRGHDWDNTGKSARYISTNQCILCHEIWKLKYREENYDRIREIEREAASKYHKENRDMILEKQKEYRKTQAFKDSLKRYRERNKEELYDKTKEWKRNNIDKLRVHYNRRRIRERQEDYERYTSEDIKIRYDEFNNVCAYCDSPDKITMDHILALSKGGKDAISNIIPACMTCNLSKGAKYVESWYVGREYFSIDKMNQILDILNKQ